MSFLAPLYLAGLAAIALPILLHLIRQKPRRRVPFSTLRFLRAAPARSSRSRRPQDLLLLAVRATALALLALAFARPFLRQPAQGLALGDAGQTLVLLVDSSASMRRGDLWEQAVARAEDAAASAGPADELALLVFDEQVRPLITCEEWRTLPQSARRDLIRRRLGEIRPGWSATRVGAALLAGADTIAAAQRARHGPANARPGRIVLISDLQEGSSFEPIGAGDWPDEVEVLLRPVVPEGATNAGLALIEEAGDRGSGADGDADIVWLRIHNAAHHAAGSPRDQFRVYAEPVDRAGERASPVNTYVPAGQSRAVAVPIGPSLRHESLRFVLEGDDHEFDNAVYRVPPPTESATVLYLGEHGPPDASGPFYYLERALSVHRSQQVRVAVATGSAPIIPGDRADLVVVACPYDAERLPPVRRHLEEGGMVLLVLGSEGSSDWLAPLLPAGQAPVIEADATEPSVLTQIDYDHPLFEHFSEARFADFSKIRFWKHRRLDVDRLTGARVLARFDDGGPAIVELPVSGGSLLVLAAGWHPEDSQLALSSKFVPLMAAALERSLGPPISMGPFEVGARVQLGAGPLDLEGPAELILAGESDGSVRPPVPGVYRARSRETRGWPETGTGSPTLPEAGSVGTRSGAPVPVSGAVAPTAPSPQGDILGSFAVNLSPAESRTAPLSAEEIERRGVRLAKVRSAANAEVEVERERTRQWQSVELEARQKGWRWIIGGALVLVVFETWLAGRCSRTN